MGKGRIGKVIKRVHLKIVESSRMHNPFLSLFASISYEIVNSAN